MRLAIVRKGSAEADLAAGRKPGTYLKEELDDLVGGTGGPFEFIVDGSLDGIWLWDLQNPEWEWMSPGFWRLFGIDPETMPHRADAWQHLIFEEDLAVAIRNFQTHLADPAHPYDQIVRYRHADGGVVTLRCRGLAIRDENGAPVWMLGAHNDLTDLVREQKRAMAADAALARASFAAKSAFVANLSHEIRTPLNVILGVCELLGEAELEPAHARLLRSAASAGNQLLSLVEDIMDLARIEEGQVSLDRTVFDLGGLVDEVLSIIGPDAEKAGFSLICSRDASLSERLVGGKRHLRQVAINLLANAIRHSGGGRAMLLVNLRPDPDRADPRALRLRLEVHDDGCGVPDALREEIFGRFNRGDGLEEVRRGWDAPHGSNRLCEGVSGGAGLGLTLSRMICAAHDGALTVGDSLLGGALFAAEVAVLRAEPEEKSAPAPVLESPPVFSRPLRLLVAEDNARNAEMLEEILARCDISADFVTDGAAALARMRAKEYDAAILDIRMPRMTGLEVAQALQTADRAARPPVLAAWTAHVAETQRQVYADAGFDLHLPKPCRIAHIRDALRDIGARAGLAST